MKRSNLVLITALTLVFAILIGCSSANTGTKPADGATAGKEGYTIFFTNAILTAPYCAIQLQAMQTYADEMGYTLQVADGKEDAQTQLDQIKNAVTQGVDGIIYFPGDQASTIPVVKYLKESGVPFIVLNSKVDDSVQDLVPSYVGSDYGEMGRIAGELTKDTLGEEGGKVVIIDGMAGTEVANSTMQGYKSAIEENGNIEILATQPADWDTAKAMTVMEDYLTTFGDNIDLVFAMDGGMAKGAAAAMENAGVWGDIPMVSSDQGQFVLDSIAEGKMYGTAMQDPYQEGRLAVEIIVKVIKGEAVETWEVVPTGKITKENVSQFKGY